MSDPTTPNKGLFTPAHNADIDGWDVPLNFNWSNLDQALGNYTTLNANGLTGTIPLSSSLMVPLGFVITGTPAASVVYQVPSSVAGVWLVRNRATLGTSITIGFNSAGGGPTVTIPAGKNLAVSSTGTALGLDDIDTVPTSVAGGSNNQIQVNIAGVLGGYAGFTIDGTTLHAPQISVDGNAIFGTGAGSTVTINGTAISAPNGFNINAGAFQMNVGGMIGIGIAPTSALMTIGGLLAVTSGGYKFPDGTIQTSAASAGPPALAVAKAWVYFDNGAVISASYNVASVVKNGAGNYTVTFTTPFATANYLAVPNVDPSGGGIFGGAVVTSASTVAVLSYNTVTQTAQDSAQYGVLCFGAQ